MCTTARRPFKPKPHQPAALYPHLSHTTLPPPTPPGPPTHPHPTAPTNPALLPPSPLTSGRLRPVPMLRRKSAADWAMEPMGPVCVCVWGGEGSACKVGACGCVRVHAGEEVRLTCSCICAPQRFQTAAHYHKLDSPWVARQTLPKCPSRTPIFRTHPTTPFPLNRPFSLSPAVRLVVGRASVSAMV